MVQARGGEGPDRSAAVVAPGESGAAADRQVAVTRFPLSSLQLSAGQLLLYAVLIILLIVTFIPIIYLVALALKDNGQIYGRFWSMPNPYRWENFALGTLVIWRPILNSILTSGSSTVATVFLASLSGYVFARHRFPGKELLYTGILALLMIPPILTLIPAYVLILNMRLENTYWALILPWTSGGQVFALLLCRSFFATLPEEFFDAARIDGASELQSFAQIAVPLSAADPGDRRHGQTCHHLQPVHVAPGRHLQPQTPGGSGGIDPVHLRNRRHRSRPADGRLHPGLSSFDRPILLRHETLRARSDSRRLEGVTMRHSTLRIASTGKPARSNSSRRTASRKSTNVPSSLGCCA